MVKHLTQIESISSSELLDEFTKIRDELKLLSKNFHSKQNDGLLTRQETAKMLKVSLSTLLNWSNAGIISSYRMGNRVFYKQNEVMASLIKMNTE